MEGRWKEEDGCQCPLPDACVTVRDKVGREARLAAAASCRGGVKETVGSAQATPTVAHMADRQSCG